MDCSSDVELEFLVADVDENCENANSTLELENKSLISFRTLKSFIETKVVHPSGFNHVTLDVSIVDLATSFSSSYPNFWCRSPLDHIKTAEEVMHIWGNEKDEAYDEKCEATGKLVLVETFFQVSNMKGSSLNHQYAMFISQMGIGYQAFINNSFLGGYEEALDIPNLHKFGEESFSKNRTISCAF